MSRINPDRNEFVVHLLTFLTRITKIGVNWVLQSILFQLFQSSILNGFRLIIKWQQSLVVFDGMYF